MRLADWLKWQGYGARAKLARSTGLTWESIQKIAHGKQVPGAANALKIQDATGGDVTVAELVKKTTRKRAVLPKRKRRRRTLAAAA